MDVVGDAAHRKLVEDPDLPSPPPRTTTTVAPPSTSPSPKPPSAAPSPAGPADSWAAHYSLGRWAHETGNIIAVRDTVTGKQRESRIVALRSLFRHAKKNGQICRNPTIRIRVPRQTGGVLQALGQPDIDEAIATATIPDIRLIVALAAIHAARPKMIRTMQLGDVDLGNRRITVGGRARPLDDIARRAVLDRLDHRRNCWPNTANPHLLITQKTAVELGPADNLWTARATHNLTATLERLRVDRQLEEALAHGADPLHLALVFGIDEKTAIRYADSARQLLQAGLETGFGNIGTAVGAEIDRGRLAHRLERSPTSSPAISSASPRGVRQRPHRVRRAACRWYAEPPDRCGPELPRTMRSDPSR